MTGQADSPGPDDPVDAVALARELIRCPSVTPEDAGALDVLEAALTGLGFACRRLPFGGDDGTARVDNLWARLGDGAPNLCFAGHTDVVPAGDAGAWSVGPFEGEVRDGSLWGRGAADMKGAVAAFVSAAAGFLADRGPAFTGSLSLLITGDEEGPAVNGTKRVLDWLAAEGENIDFCIVGEPTNPRALGEMMKIGRRGSLNGHLVVRGVQGHAAYPQRADNPLPRMLRLLAALVATPLDDGTEHFQPSNLEITAIDTGNPATNVIPGQASARFNVRYNDLHDGDGIEAWLRRTLAAADPDADWTLVTERSGDAFLTPPGPLSEAIAAAAGEVLGRTPEASTSGGTSDARFIRHFCPVAEFGLVGQTMHQTDEHVALADIAALTLIYRGVLDRLFPAAGPGA